MLLEIAGVLHIITLFIIYIHISQKFYTMRESLEEVENVLEGFDQKFICMQEDLFRMSKQIQAVPKKKVAKTKDNDTV